MIYDFFLHNWLRKAVAFTAALIIWLFVGNSITETKTIPNVPIRVVNLPPGKTVVGLLPNRMLSKRITLTLSGSKSEISEIGPGDLEVLLDVSTADSDEWLVQITKKNLVSLNPSIDLYHHVTQLKYTEFMLKLSPLITESINVKVMPPIGEPPSGYEFLDIWPQSLVQTVSGAEEEVKLIKLEGLQLVLNLNEITKADLDNLKNPHGLQDNEISFLVPPKWKKISLTCPGNALVEELNDPEAQNLRIDFLQKAYLPLNKEVTVQAFYPLKNLESINALSHPLLAGKDLEEKEGIFRLKTPLYVRDVSPLFLKLISDYLEINIVAVPANERAVLPWSLKVVDLPELEDMYVAYLMTNYKGSTGSNRKREAMLRKRFKNYMQQLAFYVAPDQRLHIDSLLTPHGIEVRVTPPHHVTSN